MDFDLVDGWSAEEQDVARNAFDVAYDRAIQQLVSSIQERSGKLDSAESLWELHDFLSIQRHTIEGRFSFGIDGILFVLASFVKDDLLQLEELAGLQSEKLAKVSAMARF